MSELLLPPARLPRWLDNFATRHGATGLAVVDGALTATAADGSRAVVRLPWGREYDGAPETAAFADRASPPEDWGVLLVRKGGYAVARLHGGDWQASKTGQRHVQGRTKAGGQSQQRFARRRENQARVAYQAAAGHAERLLLNPPCPVLVVGGDRQAVEAVLETAPLAALRDAVTDPWLAVPDPRRQVLERAVEDAQALPITVHNALPPSARE